MFSNLAIPLFAIIPLATAHFHLSWPTVRGFDSSKAGNFPCGGFDSVSSSRTEWPINGGPVQLRMEHSQTRVKVLLAIGEDPGSNFNVTLRPTFAQEGLGNFCVGQLNLPSGMNVSDGTPATIQVVSNGDPEGGLYQCADVTLTTNTLSESDYSQHCKNDTVRITSENMGGNPNETAEAEPSSTGGSPAASSRPQGGLASHQTAATWLMGVIGVAGFALL